MAENVIKNIVSMIVILILLFTNQASIVENGVCKKYIEILPSGACLEYIGQSEVLVDTTDIDSTNIKIESWFKVFVPGFINLLATLPEIEMRRHAFQSAVNLTCFGKSAFMKTMAKRIVDAIPPLAIWSRHLSFFKWFACHLVYPICIDGDKDDVSLPCKNEYDILSRSELGRISIKNIHNMSKLCPDIFKANNIFFQSNYFKYPDMRHIERCQHYSNSTFSPSQTSSDNCYIGNGVTYNGTVSVANNGKRCIVWNSIVTLRSMAYPQLMHNHCRNPQGYGDRPWCYTNFTSRDFSYCPIETCGRRKKYVTLYIVATVLTCFFGALVILCYRRIRNQGKKKLMEEYTWYASYSLKSSEQIDKLLSYD